MINLKPKFLKFRVESIKKVSKISVFREIKLPIIIWIINFIISEIIISGGLYARSVWLVAVQLVTIVVFFLVLEKSKPKTKKDKSRMAIENFAVFAILDLVVIYLGLESSNREFFNFYGTWIVYVVVAGYPFLNLKKDSAANIEIPKLSKSNQEELLTKDSYSL
jgi:hypothetical protein